MVFQTPTTGIKWSGSQNAVRLFGLCVLFYGLLPVCVAQQLMFEQLRITSSMRFNPIRAIVQDHDGLMWFGTSIDGLYRYDGQKFTSYRFQPDDSSSLTHNHVCDLLVDPLDSSIWVTHEERGVSRYERRRNRFVRYPFASAADDRVELTALARTANGRMWFGSPDREGLYTLLPDQKLHLLSWSRAAGKIYSMEACQDTLWAGGEGVLMVIHHNRIIDRYDLPAKDAASYPVHSFKRDPKGIWWVATGKGLFRLDPRTGAWTNYAHVTPNPICHDIFIDRQGHYWLSTESRVLMWSRDQQPEQGRILSHSEALRWSLSDDRCYKVFEDRTGTIWVGSYRGLNRYSPHQQKFACYYHHPQDPNSISGNYVVLLQKDQQQRLWIGTRREGIIDLMDPKGQIVKRIRLPTLSSSYDQVATAMYQLDADHYLIGTNKTLWQYHEPSDRFVEMPGIHQGRQKHASIRPMYLYRRQHLLIPSNYGLFVYDLQDKQLKRYILPVPAGESYTSGAAVIKSLYIADDSLIWIGTGERLALFDFDQKTFRYFSLRYEDRPDAPAEKLMVMAILKARQKLWLGTFKGGLLMLDLKKYSPADSIVYFKRFKQENGFPSNNVYSLLYDQTAYLWMGTNDGLVRMNPMSLVHKQYSVEDGLQDDEFNLSSAFRSADGEMFFGGINGFNRFFPANIRDNPARAEVLFTSLDILNQPDSSGLPSSQYLIGAAQTVLRHTQNFIRINFTVAEYTNPAKQQFAYRLVGYDRQWIQGGYTRAAIYTNLPYGKYEFLVKATNSDGIWNETPAVLWITIEAPFWKKWWFYALALLISTAFVYWRINARIESQQLQTRRLEAQVRERTDEIRHQKEIIEEQNLALHKSNQSKDLLFSVLSHDLKSPLHTLKGLLQIFPFLIDAGEKEELKEHSMRIAESVNASLDLLDNVLFWSRTQLDQLVAKPHVFALDELVERTIRLYQQTAVSKQILITKEGQAAAVYADSDMIFVIVRNLLTNALKFTPSGGSICIRTAIEGDFATVSVEDTGIGMSPEMIRRIFVQKESLTTYGTAREKGTGLGLQLCQTFASMNGGHIRVQSVQEKGSQFILHIPLADGMQPA